MVAEIHSLFEGKRGLLVSFRQLAPLSVKEALRKYDNKESCTTPIDLSTEFNFTSTTSVSSSSSPTTPTKSKSSRNKRKREQEE